MKTITQYKEDVKNLMKKASDIDTQATAESRELNEGELALKNEILDTVEDLSKTVATMERQERISRTLEATPAPVTVPMKGAVKQPENKDRFSSFGQQLAAIQNAGTPGGRVDARLYNAATGMGESVPSDGGFLVQQDFSNALLQQVFETGILAPNCRKSASSGI